MHPRTRPGVGIGAGAPSRRVDRVPGPGLRFCAAQFFQESCWVRESTGPPRNSRPKPWPGEAAAGRVRHPQSAPEEAGFGDLGGGRPRVSKGRQVPARLKPGRGAGRRPQSRVTGLSAKATHSRVFCLGNALLLLVGSGGKYPEPRYSVFNCPRTQAKLVCPWLLAAAPGGRGEVSWPRPEDRGAGWESSPIPHPDRSRCLGPGLLLPARSHIHELGTDPLLFQAVAVLSARRARTGRVRMTDSGAFPKPSSVRTRRGEMTFVFPPNRPTYLAPATLNN